MADILLVEDDANLRLLVAKRLSSKYTVTAVSGGGGALKIMEERGFDLIITDIMMPQMDGYEFVERLRSRGFDTPVIMLTAKVGFNDKGRGFSVGCDDYLTKPVNFEELVWRIDALLRRAKISNEGLITVGGTVVDGRSFTVTRGGAQEELPTKEFRLLFLLLSYPGKIFTKENIMDKVWGYDSDSDESTVRTHINRLRKKFEDNPDFEICTIRGVGYKAVIKK